MDEIVDSAYGPPVISDYIFDETATVTFVRTNQLPKARAVGDAMLRSFRMLGVEDDTFRRAWKRFRAQKRTRHSFTDCTTVELMLQSGIGTIATFDKEFGAQKEFAVLGASKGG